MECCEKEENKPKDKTFLKGILYGLIPHTGCIAFILFSLLGVTGAVFLFRPLLLNPYFFYILIVISILFATVSAIFYFKNKKILCYCKNDKNETELSFSLDGIKKEWKYLATLYGTTILVNLLLFMAVFPLTANLTSASFSPESYSGKISALTLQVNIPCSGHAPLITDELKKLTGILNVKFNFPNYFDVSYDPDRVSKQEILSLEVFKTYSASVTSENQIVNNQAINNVATNSSVSSSARSCGCRSSCAAR